MTGTQLGAKDSGEIKWRVEPMDKKATQTAVILSMEGGVRRINRIEIKGEKRCPRVLRDFSPPTARVCIAWVLPAVRTLCKLVDGALDSTDFSDVTGFMCTYPICRVIADEISMGSSPIWKVSR